ncbi:hypothetical protein [Paracoccus hibiscisoli]|uniref:XRE family transcriptional regulator n=1 Tax=Paracoccus hibiscisoli TaxID=2023261 RepID=A0A4U0QUK1_9RHOB|nr:hypothetical protein [Paracoccus hibiscisoli]TJZ85809.1 hypothetical protein FA740_05260 [Paracoccus hibiscisoli]
MDREKLITLIKEHAENFGLAPATITGKAVDNSRLYSRLVSGGDCTTSIAAKVSDWVDADRARRSEAMKGAAE